MQRPTGNNKTPSRSNSMKRRSRVNSSGGSYTSSSDSDVEVERREREKQKRREKKQQSNKDLPSQDKPRANLGGIINKVSQGSSRGVRRPSKDSSFKNQTLASLNLSKGPESVPSKKVEQSKSTVASHVKIDTEINEEKADTTTQKEKTTTDNKQAATEEHNNLSSVSSSSSTTDSSSQSDGDGDEKPNKQQQLSEDQLEFSNKDTTKKVRSLTRHSQDDVVVLTMILFSK